MTAVATSITPLALGKLKPTVTVTTRIEGSPINTVDDLLLSRVHTSPNTTLLAYPATPRGKNDYVDYSARDLDRFVDQAAQNYATAGLFPQHPSPNEAEVVAILAPSNLDYVVSIFALSRMGFAVLFLSNRLSTEAYVNLLRNTKCKKLIVGSINEKAAELIQAEYPVLSFNLVQKTQYDVAKSSSLRFQSLSQENASSRIAFIVHSSGSTGLPKPIFQTHKACLSNYSSSAGFRAFLTLPLYHNHGISTLFRAIYAGQKIALVNASLPLSESNLVEALNAVDPKSFHCVPYALKLLSETERGIEALKRCKLVLYGGSSCPDEVGNKLVEQGVYVVGHYGATEMGQLMTSYRSPEDKAWNYMRPLASTKPYIRMIEHTPGSYECVVLDGLPSKVHSNSSNPPNSFYTSDTFAPHPTISDAWKYLGRLDDRVTLINGEKVLPNPYEHHIRQHVLVNEVVVFGVGRAIPGMIIFPSAKAVGLKRSELLDLLMPTIDFANSRTEAFGRISQDMIEFLDMDTEYPRTDKGTVIRAAFYRKFAELIDSIYIRFEAPLEQDKANLKVLELPELETYLLDVFKSKLGVAGLEASTDFFDAGVDSLQAITARACIMREIDLASNVLGQNVVFEKPNVQSLARHLYSLRTGSGLEEKDELQLMAELIEKYSSFPARVPGTVNPDGESIILTGATGSLGAHILALLARRKNVKTIYCFVRASTPTAAEQRVQSTLASKKLGPFTAEESGKIVCLPADLSKSDFGLDDHILSTIMNSLTAVIHSAWAVNFNLGVSSFESHHIRGTYNLLNACLQTRTVNPARLYFCSSISAAAGTPLPAVVPETYISELAYAQNMGYARSKLVTENIVKAAMEKTRMCARVLRLGQIVGDTQHGLWNATEAIPLMIQSASTIGALPELDETPSWMPVDEAARAVLEFSSLNSTLSSDPDAEQSSTVYHVQNTRSFHWTKDLLPALRSAGLKFETVHQREWVRRLREGEQDPTKNPTIKLFDFFTEKYDNDRPGRSNLVFVMDLSSERSTAVKQGFDVLGTGLMAKTVFQWGLRNK